VACAHRRKNGHSFCTAGQGEACTLDIAPSNNGAVLGADCGTNRVCRKRAVRVLLNLQRRFKEFTVLVGYHCDTNFSIIGTKFTAARPTVSVTASWSGATSDNPVPSFDTMAMVSTRTPA